MAQYAITRKLNNKEYFLENIYSDDKIIWITDNKQALLFEKEKELKEFIANEFPGKDYYPTAAVKSYKK